MSNKYAVTVPTSSGSRGTHFETLSEALVYLGWVMRDWEVATGSHHAMAEVTSIPNRTTLKPYEILVAYDSRRPPLLGAIATVALIGGDYA